MIYSNLFDLAPNQLAHTPPPEPCVFYTRPPKVQGPGNFSAQDVPYIIKFDEISERARERTEQRRLRRIAALKIQATSNAYGAESPGAIRPSKSHTPPLPPDTPSEVPNQPRVPTKLTRHFPTNPDPTGIITFTPVLPLRLLSSLTEPHGHTNSASPTRSRVENCYVNLRPPNARNMKTTLNPKTMSRQLAIVVDVANRATQALASTV